MEDDDALPLSALSHIVYCERRVALVHVLGTWIENAHTAAGHLIHRRIDRGETTSKPGLRVLRSVNVRSERLRLRGVIDLVEVHGEGRGVRFVPVETKKGPRRRWERDEVQLCAQAMALEEATQTRIEEGAIFHAASQRRRPVRIDDALRATTEAWASRLHAIVSGGEVPRAVPDPRCGPCSLRSACQPDVHVAVGSLAARLREALE